MKYLIGKVKKFFYRDFKYHTQEYILSIKIQLDMNFKNLLVP